MKIVLNTDKLDQIQSSLPQDVSELVLTLAQNCEAYIKDNFSPDSPSQPYTPPAVDTGYLKSSIVSQRVRRDTAMVYVGAEYGISLEYGTDKMQPRPFVLPALEFVANRFARYGIIKEIVES